MNYEKFCFELAKLDNEKQEEFFNCVKDTITQEEKRALQIGIAYFRLLLFPELKEAMQAAILEELKAMF